MSISQPTLDTPQPPLDDPYSTMNDPHSTTDDSRPITDAPKVLLPRAAHIQRWALRQQMRAARGLARQNILAERRQRKWMHQRRPSTPERQLVVLKRELAELRARLAATGIAGSGRRRPVPGRHEGLDRTRTLR